MACVDENALAAYLAREATPAESDRIEAHLATCASCRALVDDVAELGVAAGAGPAEAEAAPAPARAPLVRGTSVGRYVLLRVLGEGGFGIVYAAHDPTLDRVVALKLLRPDAIEDAERSARFVREARTMARIGDPHVVAVHDAGEIGGRVFLAMELFDGDDLRTWIRAERRSWREVLRVFVAAGRGLAAAHAAGVVHRDFKPANVLLRRDGRASVTDFGLAERRGEAATGGLAGTPAYMAPEVLRGEAATPASDQFAFGVALAEAISGAHPYAAPGAGPREVARAIRAGERLAPLPAGLPRRVRRAVDRALAADPAARFGSMAELLETLAPDRKRPVAGIVLAALAAVAVAGTAAWREERTHRCDAAGERIDQVWNDATRSDVARALAASGAPYADEAAATVRQRLDAYAARWKSVAGEACAATRIRGEQSDEALDAKATCLDRGRIEIRTLVESARGAGGKSVAPADLATAAGNLPDLSACEDTTSLLAPPPAPAAIRADVAAVRGGLAEAHARRSVGQVGRADAIVEDALVRAQRLAYPPLLAEAWTARGVAAAEHGDPAAAQRDLEEALRAASRGRHDRAAAEAWVALVDVAGVLRSAPEAGLSLRAGAVAALDRLGSSTGLAARLASTTALLDAALGRFDEALAEHRNAIRLYAEAGGPDAPAIGRETSHVAEMLAELGRWDEAAAAAELARSRIAASFGEHHPATALPLSLLARRATLRGDGATAIRLADEAIAVRQTASVRENEAPLLPLFLVRARARSVAGRFDDAAADLDRARTIADAAFGPTSAWAGLVSAALGDALLAKGTAEQAVYAFLHAVGLLESARGSTDPDTAEARVGLAAALLASARGAAAAAPAEAARAALAAHFGETSPRLVPALLVQARSLRVLGRLEEARRAADAAVRAGAEIDTTDLRAAHALAHELGG